MKMKSRWAALAVLTLLSACSTAPVDSRLTLACPINMARSPAAVGEGVVVNLLDTPAAMALLAKTEAQIGGPIDPVYLNNQRAVIRMLDGRQATVLIPLEMSVGVGDRITFQGSYRSPYLPCSYVPNLATRKL
jgi:hypothetical protein